MSLIREAFNVLLPGRCMICGGYPDADSRIPYDVPDGFHICFGCLSTLIPQPSESRFFTLLSEPYEGDPVPDVPLYMPFPYKGFFEKAVPKMKFHSCPELASFCGTVLGNLMLKDGLNADVMVPVPLSSSRLKERGYNQAGLIAESASKVCSVPCIPDVLVRVKETMRQTEIRDDAKRSLNVHGAFGVCSDYDIEGLQVMLIDDVATTGNTMHEAAAVLRDTGASKVLCVALCGNRAVLNAESI